MRPLHGQIVGRVALTQAGVGLAVGHVRAEAAVLDEDRSLRIVGVGAQVLQRWLRTLPLATLGLSQLGECLLEGHGEQLILRVEAAAVFALLDVRPIATVECLDLLTVGRIDADHARQRQQLHRLVQADGGHVHGGEQRGGTRLVIGLVGIGHRHVRPIPARFHLHRPTGVRVGAQLPVARRRIQQFRGLLQRQLIGRQVFGHPRPVIAALQIRAVASNPGHHLASLVVGTQRDRVDLPCVDVPQVFRDHAGQPGITLVGTEVEAAQPWNRLLRPAGNTVEVVLHACGKRVVDQLREVPLEQTDHGEGREAGDQGRSLLPHVPPVEDRGDDRGVRGRTAHTQLLKALHQRRLGET